MVLNNVIIDFWNKLGKFSNFWCCSVKRIIKPLKNCKYLPGETMYLNHNFFLFWSFGKCVLGVKL